MSWEPTGKPKVMSASKKIAQEWSEMQEAREDRPLSEKRIAAYRRMIEDQSFRPVTWSRVFCKETDQWYRVNGKHTSTLFASLEPAELEGLVIVLEDYSCDTLEDVARLYATFDSKTQIRNASDINKSFAAIVPELSHLAYRHVNLCVGALAWDAKPSTPHLGSPQDRAERLFDNVKVVLWLCNIVPYDTKKCGHMFRVPVMGAMVSTYRKHQGDANTFWLAVREEDGVKPTSPDRKLAKFLSGVVVESGPAAQKPRIGQSLSRRASPREIYVKCLHAWNAWRKGGETDMKYYPAADIPSVR